MACTPDPRDEEDRSGGWYELAVELHPATGVAGRALEALSRLAGVEPVDGGHVLRLPGGPRVLCALAEVEDEDGVWAVLGLPLGALARADPRVGGYPFGEGSGAAWRRPLDDWLASLAVRLFDVVPFRLALVGFEVSGELCAAELTDGVPDRHDHVGLVVVADRPVHHPATYGT